MSDPNVQMDSIANYLTGVGTDNDPMTQGRPTVSNRLSSGELGALFVENDLARRIVEEIVDDSFRSGLPSLYYHDTGESVKLGTEERRDIIELFTETAVTGRLYGGAHLMLMVDDNRTLDQPLNFEELPELDNAFPVDRYEATPETWGGDAREDSYMEPQHYSIHPSNTGAADTSRYPRVHRSRLLTFRGARLPRRLKRRNNDYDDAVLQNVWQALSNFYQSEQAIANIINRFEVSTISIAGLSEIQSEPEGEELIRKRLQLMHRSLAVLNAALVDEDAGEEYTRKFANVQGLEALWDRLAASVAKAARMPMTQLFGEASSGIRGDDEAGAKGWRKQVDEFRTTHLLLPVIKYVSLLKGRRVEPARNSKGQPLWGPPESPKPVDEARIGEMRSNKALSLLDAGVISVEEARSLMAGNSIDWEDGAPEVEVDNDQE